MFFPSHGYFPSPISSFPSFSGGSSRGGGGERAVWLERGEGAEAIGSVAPSTQLDRGGGGQDGREEGREEGLESESGGTEISGGATFVPVVDEELLERIFD